MGFVDNPIITSPFDVAAFHYELDDDGQPTGVKLQGRRESRQVVPVPVARRRGPRQAELELIDTQGAEVTPTIPEAQVRPDLRQGDQPLWRRGAEGLSGVSFVHVRLVGAKPTEVI